MFCYKCGKKLKTEMKFCPYCGAKTIKNKSQTPDNKSETVICENEEDIQTRKNINLTAPFKKVGQFLYDYRQLFISGFALILILLFFCPFICVKILNVEITSVNGFQALYNLFAGDFFANIGNGTLDSNNVSTLISIAYLLYFVEILILIKSIIKNLVSFFKTKSNVNKSNFADTLSLLILNILLVVFYYVICSRFDEIVGKSEAIKYISGVLALMIISIVPFVYATTCCFCKLNQEEKTKDHLLLKKLDRFTPAIFFILMVIAMFTKVCSLPVDNNVGYNLFQLAYIDRNAIIYIGLFCGIIGVGLLVSSILTICNKNRIAHIINICFNCMLLFVYMGFVFVYLTDNTTFAQHVNKTLWLYSIIILSLMSVGISIYYLKVIKSTALINEQTNNIQTSNICKVTNIIATICVVVTSVCGICISKVDNKPWLAMEECHSTMYSCISKFNEYFENENGFDENINQYALVRDDTCYKYENMTVILESYRSLLRNAKIIHIDTTQNCSDQEFEITNNIPNTYKYVNGFSYILYIETDNKEIYYTYVTTKNEHSFGFRHDDNNWYEHAVCPYFIYQQPTQ